MKWIFRLPVHGLHLPVIVHYLCIVWLSTAPAENQSPLIVDADWVKPLQLTFQRLKPIARRNSQILQVCCIVQVQKLSPGDSAKFIGERSGWFALPVIEEVFSECIPKRLDHVSMLSEHDNTGKAAFRGGFVAIASCGRFAGLAVIRSALSWEKRCGCSNLS